MSVIDSYLDNLDYQKYNPNLKSNKYLNSFFDKIYVINLHRSLSRLIRITDQFRYYNIEYEIFDAVDGSNDEIVKEYEDYVYQRNQKGLKAVKRVGEYAYLLTWSKLLKKIIEEGVKKVLVFEDDIMLCDNFGNKVEKWLTNLPKNTLVWLLGASQLPHLRSAIIEDLDAFRPRLTDGSFAVGLSNNIFRYLLNQVELLNDPFDSGPLRAVYNNPDFKDFCYVAWPHLVIAEVANSYIRKSKNIQIVADKLEWNLKDFSSYLKKHIGKIKIALSLYGELEDTSQINELFNDPCIDWDIFLVNSSKNKLEKCELSNKKIRIYPKRIDNITIAKEITNLAFTNKYDRKIFYDLSLRLNENLLKALSTLANSSQILL